MSDDLFDWAEREATETVRETAAMGSVPAAPAQAAARTTGVPELPAGAVVFTVAELSRTLKARVEGEFNDVWVEGEASGCGETRGTLWLQLKDADALLKAVVWPSTLRALKFVPRDGDRVLCRGRLDVYPPRGEYRLVINEVVPRGLGALLAARKAIEERLAAEGLLDARRKRPLPFLPRRVGLVTSPTGAAVRDFIRQAELRFPRLRVVLAPARVQGEGAARTVVAALARLARLPDLDVVVVTRGGGSAEDLWAFNDEELARAIAAYPVPVVSAVGHERDVTIADLVADVRASTPSAAAVAVFPVYADLAEALRVGQARLARAVRRRADDARARLDLLAEKLLGAERQRAAAGRKRVEQLRARLGAQDPQRRLAQHRRSLGALHDALVRRAPGQTAARRTLAQLLAERLRAAGPAIAVRRRGLVRELDARLQSLSPLRVLDRGYALVRDDGGRLVTDAGAVASGAALEVQLRRGRLDVAVARAHPPDPREEGNDP